MSSIDPKALKDYVESEFTNTMLPGLKEFITIPCTSRAYDPDWEKNGYLLNAATMMKRFAEGLKIDTLNAFYETEENLSPFLIITIDGSDDVEKSVLFYGHLDKQPGGEGWKEGLSPYTPVEVDGYLYGRGSADDGYALFSVLLMVKALKKFGVPHPNIRIIIEGGEESGSRELPYYFDKYADAIGEVHMVISLDSGIADYERVWLTTALRGDVTFDLSVTTLKKGVHSGKGSGIAPESFMILRKLISRIEDTSDSFVRLKDFEKEIPQKAKDQAEKIVSILGENFLDKLPLYPSVLPLGKQKKFTPELYLNSTWKPSLAVTGIRGVPAMKDAGNVLRPATTARISIRTPPTYETQKEAENTLTNTLTQNPPFNSTVSVNIVEMSDGIVVPEPKSGLINTLTKIETNYMKSGYATLSLGATIPFVELITKHFSNAIIVVTGAAGFDSNIHGPNERLNLSYTKSFICTITHLLSEFKSFL